MKLWSTEIEERIEAFRDSDVPLVDDWDTYDEILDDIKTTSSIIRDRASGSVNIFPVQLRWDILQDLHSLISNIAKRLEAELKDTIEWSDHSSSSSRSASTGSSWDRILVRAPSSRDSSPPRFVRTQTFPGPPKPPHLIHAQLNRRIEEEKEDQLEGELKARLQVQFTISRDTTQASDFHKERLLIFRKLRDLKPDSSSLAKLLNDKTKVEQQSGEPVQLGVQLGARPPIRVRHHTGSPPPPLRPGSGLPPGAPRFIVQPPPSIAQFSTPVPNPSRPPLGQTRPFPVPPPGLLPQQPHPVQRPPGVIIPFIANPPLQHPVLPPPRYNDKSQPPPPRTIYTRPPASPLPKPSISSTGPRIHRWAVAQPAIITDPLPSSEMAAQAKDSSELTTEELLRRLSLLETENRNLKTSQKDDILFETIYFIEEERRESTAYLDEPTWAVGLKGAIVLKSKFPIPDVEGYIEQKQGVAFIVGKYYSPDDQKAEVQKAVREKKQIPQPIPKSETIRLESDEMKDAMDAYIANNPNIQKVLPHFSSSDPISAPYLFWYHHRSENAFDDLEEEHQEYMHKLTGWIDENYGEVYTRVQDQLDRGMISHVSMVYLIKPGDAVIVKAKKDDKLRGELSTYSPQVESPQTRFAQGQDSVWANRGRQQEKKKRYNWKWSLQTWSYSTLR